MPLIQSTFIPPWYLRNPHVQTIGARLFREIPFLPSEPERIITPDQDFFDVDWYRNGHRRLAILSHGLEGSARAPYMLGMINSLIKDGWDCVGINARGCSGSSNNQAASYHSGFTNDLKFLCERVATSNTYSTVSLIGFSVGGNITAKYLGQEENIPSCISSAAVLSVPFALAAASEQLGLRKNTIYMQYFLRSLKQKTREKAKRFPAEISTLGLKNIKDFLQYDGCYTAPLFGFPDAPTYWKKASSKPLLSSIQVPLYILTSHDDPFLDATCYPQEEAAASNSLFLEITQYGGHMGFIGKNGSYAEKRVRDFLREVHG